jgi:hypothetical protein
VRPVSEGSQWKVGKPDLYGCTFWLGKLDRDGYGRIWNGPGRPALAHREAWEARHGPIPAGLELEHRCRRRDCVALYHLKLVTRTQNERLKRWRSRVKAELCDAGHDALQAMVTPEGGRVCRICR